MISDYKNILYVSDLDKGSRPAFRAAVSLTKTYDAKLTYLHVVEKVSGTAKSLLNNMMDKQEIEDFLKEGVNRLKEKAQRRVEKFCQEELQADSKLAPDQIDVMIAEGNAWKIILKVADELDADLIVMGTRRNRSLDKLFLGSTATKVLNNTQRPIMVVPLTS